MKNYLLLIGLITVTFLFGACSPEEQSDSEKKEEQMSMETSDHSDHANMQMGSGEPTGESIYNVSSSWKTRHGDIVKLDSLRGKVQVVAMVYTHCEYACPRIVADMKRIRDSLSDEALAETNFTIVSIDPERDTPHRLQQFADENDLSDDQWTLLNGDQGDILELAALLGFKYKRTSDTDFTHSNMITVLNKEGEVAYQRNKLADKPTDAIKTIEKLADTG